MKTPQQQPTLFGPELPICETKTVESVTKAVIPDDWYLTRWVQFATPQWTRILKESIEAGDKRREEYARKILRETLGVKDG